MNISIRVNGTDAVSRRLLNMESRVSNLEPAFRSIAKMMQTVSRRQFDSQGRSGGSGWTPLKSATVARKRSQGKDSRILHADKKLRQSLTVRGSSGHEEEFSKSRMFYGTSVDYAIHHQRGAPGANVPQRKIIELNNEDRREMVKRVQKHIVKGRVL